MKTGNVFDVAATSYLQDDANWGSDIDFLKSAFESVDTPIDYLDVGCGPGFHIWAVKRIYPEARVWGMDQSVCMLQEAERLCTRPGLNVGLLNDNLFTTRTRLRSNVISFLNNGLGNVCANGKTPAESRSLALKKLRLLVRDDGYLVVSVYHLSKLKEPYGRNINILKEKCDFKHGDLFLEHTSRDNKVTEYYSHWFTRDEIAALLERNGFQVELLEVRMARLVVKAKAM